jgi:hypothetical protein
MIETYHLPHYLWEYIGRFRHEKLETSSKHIRCET